MSRTVRRHPKTRRPMRDGSQTQHVDRSCEHHGGCPWCERNRTFSNRRRAPIEERA